MQTDSTILSPLQDKQRETLELHLMPTAGRTTGRSVAAVESLYFKDLGGSINSLGTAVKVWAERPLQMQHMLHGQLSKPCWASRGQQEAELVARTALEGKP